jgi:ATP-dependent RNA helicase DDX51/DBP6
MLQCKIDSPREYRSTATGASYVYGTVVNVRRNQPRIARYTSRFFENAKRSVMQDDDAARERDKKRRKSEGKRELHAKSDAAATTTAAVGVETEAKRRKKLFAQPDKMPEFMRQAQVIRAVKDTSFADLGLSDRMVERLTQHMDLARPFPVQAALVPFVLRDTRYAGGDALVMSATGSGKTLAFALPVVELLCQTRAKGLSCLCVLPTKDIALQVFEVFASLCEGTAVSVALVAGERSFFAEQTTLQMERPQILVATPGRLRDHVLTSISAESLQALRWLVIDEGDRLLAEQYHQWLDDVMPHLLHPADVADGPFARPPLQKLVFSATMTSNPRKLAKLKLYRPVFFHALDQEGVPAVRGAPVLPASLLEFKVVCPSEEERPLVLMWLLESGLVERRGALVFVNSVERAQVLYDVVEPLLALKQLRVGLYSSRVLARDRAQALAQFKTGELRALIVTDVLARGLDLQQAAAVVNYDTPFREEAYVHRVGRTARAGKAGEAYVLGLWTELASWAKMRSSALQGGNVAEKKLRPSKAQLEEMRPAFVDQLELLKRKKRHDAVRPQQDKELFVPLDAAHTAAALKVLRRNHAL